MESDFNTNRRLNNLSKTNVNFEDLRRRRNDQTVELRKNKRDILLRKKRTSSVLEFEDAESFDDRKLIELTDEILKQLIEDLELYDTHSSICYEAVKAVRRYLSHDYNPPIDRLLNAGLLKPLVNILKSATDSTIKFEAAWAITNVASGNSEQTAKVVQSGATNILIDLLDSEDLKVVEQAFWALGNIIGDGPSLRDFVLNLGIVDPILKYIKPGFQLTFLRNVTWVIVNLCRYKNPSIKFDCFLQLIPAFQKLLEYEDQSILVDVLWALSYITDCGAEYVQVLINFDLICKTTPFLSHSETPVQTAALRVLGNVVTGSDEQTQCVLDYNVLTHFQFLLKHERPKIRKEAVWFISNITAGSQSQIQKVFDSGLIPLVINNLRNGDYSIKKEAIWAISNLTLNGSVQHISKILELGVIQPFCDFLEYQEPQMILIVLEGINNMLRSANTNLLSTILILIEECGGLDKIEHLQSHDNSDIYKMSYEIIENYFSDKNDDVNLVPESEHGQFVFEETSAANPSFNL